MSKIVNDVEELGNILGIWAHPDDETWASAGVMCRARKNNQKVICINATRGELGVQDENRWPVKNLAHIRTKELEKSLDYIGAGIKHYWLDYRDGECANVGIDEAVDRIFEIVKAHTIDTILTFGSDGLTGHFDHSAVSRWASQLVDTRFSQNKPKILHVVESKERYYDHLKELDKDFNIYFNIDMPPVVLEQELDLCVRLDVSEVDSKIMALKAQESQTSQLFSRLDRIRLVNILNKECFVLAPSRQVGV